MTGEGGQTGASPSGWTIDTLATHMQAMREGDARFEEERDRRYTEVAVEREKALRIKEQADRDALGLAREIQTYKDEKANELREQINSERGNYASKGDLQAVADKLEATIKPLAEYIAASQGKSQGVGLSANVIAVAATVLISLFALIAVVYFNTHHTTEPIVVTTPAVTTAP